MVDGMALLVIVTVYLFSVYLIGSYRLSTMLHMDAAARLEFKRREALQMYMDGFILTDDQLKLLDMSNER